MDPTLRARVQNFSGNVAQLREQVIGGKPVTAEQLDDLAKDAAEVRDLLGADEAPAEAAAPPVAPAPPLKVVPPATPPATVAPSTPNTAGPSA